MFECCPLNDSSKTYLEGLLHECGMEHDESFAEIMCRYIEMQYPQRFLWNTYDHTYNQAANKERDERFFMAAKDVWAQMGKVQTTEDLFHFFERMTGKNEKSELNAFYYLKDEWEKYQDMLDQDDLVMKVMRIPNLACDIIQIIVQEWAPIDRDGRTAFTGHELIQNLKFLCELEPYMIGHDYGYHLYCWIDALNRHDWTYDRITTDDCHDIMDMMLHMEISPWMFIAGMCDCYSPTQWKNIFENAPKSEEDETWFEFIENEYPRHYKKLQTILGKS